MRHPCAVYRWFDADGRLLYVGKSFNPESRWRQHQRIGHAWTNQAVTRHDEWFLSEQEALDAEVAVIRAERPPGNRQLRRGARSSSAGAGIGAWRPAGLFLFHGDSDDPATWTPDTTSEYWPGPGGDDG